MNFCLPFPALECKAFKEVDFKKLCNTILDKSMIKVDISNLFY